MWQYGTGDWPRQGDNSPANLTDMAKIINDQGNAYTLNLSVVIPVVGCNGSIAPSNPRYKQDACRQVEPVCTRTANHDFSQEWVSIDLALKNPTTLQYLQCLTQMCVAEQQGRAGLGAML